MHKHVVSAANICLGAPAAGSKITELSQRDQDYIIYFNKNTDGVEYNKENQWKNMMNKQKRCVAME